MTLEVNVSGAVVDGSWPDVMEGIGQAVAEPVAYQAYAEWHNQLNRNLRFPTPIYETRVRVDQSVPDWRVHDGGMAYGPWLEGTGSRNFPVTRFRGYQSAETATAQVVADIDRLVQPVVDGYIERLG